MTKQILGKIIGQDSLSFIFGVKPYVIDSTHPFFEGLKNALKTNDVEYIEQHVDIKQGIVSKSNGLLELVDGIVYFDGKVLHNVVSTKIQQMLIEGFDVQPMLKFLENLLQNPSKTSVDELYLFLESGNLPITEDGHFLAYKKVRDNYFDIYSGTFNHSVGQILEMPRNQVCDNRERTCSYGFHFCSFDYLSQFNSKNHLTDRIVIVKIDPKDVVSIPSDYNNTKGRTCRYEVIGEVSREDAPNAFPSVVDTIWDFLSESYDEKDFENSWGEDTGDSWNEQYEQVHYFTVQNLGGNRVIYRNENGDFVSKKSIDNLIGEGYNVEINEFKTKN